MAKFTGTMVTTDAKGLREDLTDLISNISPTKTPLMSMIGRSKAKAVLHEWQIDTLATPSTSNQKAEGNEATYATPSSTQRIGNYVQISDKTCQTSGTLEAIDKAGRKSEMAYQMAKRGAELKRDMEANMFENIAASGTDPRKTGGLGAWLYTNTDFASGSGGDPVYTTLPNSARTDATAGDLRTFQETQLKSVISSAWTNGGEPSVAFMGAFAKAAFSGFDGEYTKTFETSKTAQAAIVAASDVYVSDFGVIKVVPSRFNRIRDVYVIDPEYMSVMYLRPFQTQDLAKTGDAEKKLLLVEWGLKVNNEAAHGAIFDLKA